MNAEYNLDFDQPTTTQAVNVNAMQILANFQGHNNVSESGITLVGFTLHDWVWMNKID